MTTARGLALTALLDVDREWGRVQEILDRRLRAVALSDADRRLATQLVYGCLRSRSLLDAILRSVVAREPEKVEGWLWEALRLGAYQLLFLDHVPPHAAVHATVEMLTELGKTRAKGFANGVLRSVGRLILPETRDKPSADAIPISEGRYLRLARPVLPDPTTQPVEYLSTAFGLPDWLQQRWLSRFGWEECVRLGFWFDRPSPTWLRCNLVAVERGQVRSALEARGLIAEDGDVPESLRLRDSAAIRGLPGYEEGWFTVQDLSAMRVGRALAPEPGWRVLDLCAAPGGKTTHLAELMKNQGEIVACDVDAERLASVDQLARRLRLNIIHMRHIEREPPPGPFDAVLLDVPCSNTGVVGRRPEVRWRLRTKHLPRLVDQQRRLLWQAVDRVRSGGAIVYSTCSIEPEENADLIAKFCATGDKVVLEEECASQPGRPADGGYWARLRKK